MHNGVKLEAGRLSELKPWSDFRTGKPAGRALISAPQESLAPVTGGQDSGEGFFVRPAIFTRLIGEAGCCFP